MADSVVELRVQALEEQDRRRKSVKSLWLCPVAVGVMIALLAYWVCMDANLKAAMNERISTLEEIVQKNTAILSQEIAEAKNTARALRHEVGLLAKKHRDETVRVNVAALQREIDQLRENTVTEDYIEALKQQLKQKHDEAASKSRVEFEAVRQELIDLLRDKQSKKSFLLENSLIKQEMDRLKRNEEALKREVELLKNKTANPPAEHLKLTTENDSLRDVFELKGQQHLLRQELKKHEQVFKNELESLKQQLKRKQDEAASQSRTEAVRQEFADLLRDKQSKMTFLLENSMIKQEIDRLKHNEEALKHEIELFKNKTANPPAEALKQEIGGLLQKQQAPAENMQWRQEIDSVKQTLDSLRPICKEMSDSLNALDNAVKEQKILIIELTKKQETDRECFTRAIVELWDRQELVRTVRPEINHLRHLRRSDQVFRKEIETMKQLNQNQQQGIEELSRRHHNHTQTELTKLADFCSQIYSTTEVYKVEVENLAQRSLSTESVWRLVVVLWMSFYLFIYHQKFRNKTQGKIHELIEKQETDREYLKGNRDAKRGVVSDSLRAEVDKLKEDQESDRAEVDKLKEDQESDRAEVDKLKEDQESDRAEVDKLKEKQESVRAEVDKLKEKQESDRAEVDKLKEDQESDRAEVDKLKEDQESDRAEVDKLKEDQESDRAEVDKLKEKQESVRAEVDKLKEKQESDRAEVDKLKEDQESDRAEVDKLKEDQESDRAEVDKLKEDRESDRAEVDKLKEDQESDRAEVDKLKGDQESDRAEVDKLKEKQESDGMLLQRVIDALRRYYWDEYRSISTR